MKDAQNSIQINARIHARMRTDRFLSARASGFKDYEEQLLSIAAFQAHPSWEEPRAETLLAGTLVLQKAGEKTWKELDALAISVNGRVFIKTDKKGPNTITTVVKWFQKNHPDQAKGILNE